MSTPERPSLADTLAHIDAVLDAYYDPTTNTREVDVVTRITSIVDHAAKPCLHCARKSLIGSLFCAYHLPCPIDQDPDAATAEVLRIVQGDFARHEREYLRGLHLDVRPPGGITENGHVLPWTPYLQPALDEAARQSAAQPEQPGHRRSCQHDGPPGPDCPGCTEVDELLAIAHTNAAPFPPPAERPGWLARALHRLFGDGGP